MGAFKCDTDALNSKVNLNLKKGKSCLDDGANTLASISIPSNFSYAGSLSSMPSTIRNNGEKVNELQRWVTDVVNKFTNAESANNSIVNGIKNNININYSTESVAVVKSETTSISSIFENIGSIIESFVIDAVENARAIKGTNANIEVSYENPITMEEGFEVLSTFIDSIPFMKNTATTICTAFNALSSIIKGLTQFVGALIDVGAILGGAVISAVTGIGEIIAYLCTDSTLSIDELEENLENGITAKIWGTVMDFVSTSYVENAWNDFYENNLLGQFIDSYAVGIFKHDGIGCNILSGIGYVGGIVALTVFTAGVAGLGLGASAGAGTAAGTAAGTMASTTTSTLISSAYAAISAFGKYTGESWAEDKMSSWEGIQEAVRNGDISQSDYEKMKQIRDLSDEEWNEIYNEYLNGNITLEQLQEMKQIRKIPDDWKTAENTVAGLEYGSLNALWEGAQWLVGGFLGEITAGFGKVGASIRVGVDSLFNTADTPFRSLITAATEGKSFGDVFETNGGWSSVITDLIVGLIGSTGGEIFNSSKLNNNTLNNDDAFVTEINESKLLDKLKEFIGNKNTNINVNANSSQNANRIDYSKFNTPDIDLTEFIKAKNAYMKFYEDNIQFFQNYGIDKNFIEQQFNQVCLCNDQEYLNYVKMCFGHGVSCTAFNYQGYSFLPSNSLAKDIAHEITHSFGNIYLNEQGQYVTNYIALDEAFTETVATSIGLDAITAVSYSGNTDFIREISEKLDTHGYYNAFFDAYILRNGDKIKNIIDRIAGNGSYNELANMFKESQNAFVEAYQTNDWSKYYTIKSQIEDIISRLN